ncbi:unnamed protein product [Agarophyton chilense]
MAQTAFLSAFPVVRISKPLLAPPRAPHLLPTPRSLLFSIPTCSLAQHIRKAVFTCAAIGLTILPPHTRATPTHFDPIQHSPVLVTSANLDRFSHSVAVVGVAKSAIHDYAISAEYFAPVEATDTIDEARREICLATRLITAVLLGAIVGVERSATTLNLGVRSVTLISLSSAMASVMVASMHTIPPLILAYPSLCVLLVSFMAGVFVYTAAKLRRPRPSHIGAMSSIVALGVAMGTACGYGLSLITILCCLGGIFVMRQKHASPMKRRGVSRAVTSTDADLTDSRERLVEAAGPPLDAYSTSRRPEGVDG